jgi:hypothetical protein
MAREPPLAARHLRKRRQGPRPQAGTTGIFLNPEWSSIMSDQEENWQDLFKRDLSADELEAARAATPGETVGRRQLKRIRRNAILAVRRKVTGHAERHWRRERQ